MGKLNILLSILLVPSICLANITLPYMIIDNETDNNPYDDGIVGGSMTQPITGLPEEPEKPVVIWYIFALVIVVILGLIMILEYYEKR